MSSSFSHVAQQMEARGFVLLPEVFAARRTDEIILDLTSALAKSQGEGAIGIQSAQSAQSAQSGGIYAARNVLRLWPEAALVWRQHPLPEALASVLGKAFGLVRVLFFDKPPDQTWALPWHKDMTIAVRDNRLPSLLYGKPTRKAGVPHVEAPREVLDAMLTARIHLDEITEENGPLKVLPGSHRSGKELALGETAPQTILSGRGDVLLMRPLVAHASVRSHPETHRHRRILHLEFCSLALLPDHYEWHDFIPA